MTEQGLNTAQSTLHFISVEKYPLSKAQLAQSLKILPELEHFSQQLIAQYPDSPEERYHLKLYQWCSHTRINF